MAHPGFNPADERTWWWKVAKHLDDAQLALLNAIAHNVDDPRPLQDLQARLREGQAILLYIFQVKGLLPGSLPGPNGVPGHSAPMVPPHGQQPAPPPPWAQAPSAPPPPWFPTDFADDIAAATAAAAAAAVMTPAPSGDQSAPIETPSTATEVAPEVGQAAPIADDPPTVTANGDGAPATEPAPATDLKTVDAVEPAPAVSETPTAPRPDAAT